MNYLSVKKISNLVIKVLLDRAFSHDVTADILVFQNNKMAAMLVYQANLVGIVLFSYVNPFLALISLHSCLRCHVSGNALHVTRIFMLRSGSKLCLFKTK